MKYISKYKGAEIDAAIGESIEHIDDSEIHVTAEDKTKWDANISNLKSHVDDATIHVTETDKANWNAKATQSALASHVNNIGIHVDETDKTKWNAAIFPTLPETVLSDAADADDYTTDGQYTTTGLDLTTLTNFAQNSVGFELIVMHTVSSNRGVQVMITSAGDVYIRAFNSANTSGAFSGMNWKKLTSEAVT